MKPIDFAAACVYSSSFKDINFDHFILTIETIALLDGYSVKVVHRTDGEFLILSLGSVHVKLDCGRKPLAMEGFSNPLMSPYLLAQNVDFKNILENHKENILVTVGSGDGVFNAEHLGMIADMGIDMGLGESETHAQMEYRLKLLHRVTTYIAKHTQPDLIHWTQSEQLFRGAEYLTLENDELPLLLVLHPFLFQGQAEGEVQAIIVGAEQLIHKALSINSVALDPASFVEIATVFVHYCRQIKAIPDDGNTVGREEEWIVRVKQVDANEANPHGKVELTVLTHKLLTQDQISAPQQDTARANAPTQVAQPTPKTGLSEEQRLKDALREQSVVQREKSTLLDRLGAVQGKWVLYLAFVVVIMLLAWLVLPLSGEIVTAK